MSINLDTSNETHRGPPDGTQGYIYIKKCTLFEFNVFSTKVLIGDTIFTSPTGDGTAILRGSSLLQSKGNTFISRLF